MIHLYDAMNVVRRALETDPMGRAPRTIVTSMLTLAKGDVALWCWDAPGSRATRRAIFPAYKSKRKPHPENIWPMIDFVKETLCHTHAIQVEVSGFEADDIVATLARRFTGLKKHIHSTDRDLGQLLDAQTTADFKNTIEPQWIRLYKTCVGDPGDDIPGIGGFGATAWERLSDWSKGMLQDAIERGFDHPGRDAEAIAPLSKRCQNWVRDNGEQLLAMWQIVGLLTVPDAELQRGTTAGVADQAKVEALLKRYHH